MGRLAFELREEMAKTHRGVAHDDPFPALQCSTCQKWRRVDASTRDVFSNRRWLYDKEREEERALNSECGNLNELITAWLDKLHGSAAAQPVGLAVYHAFCNSSEFLTGLASTYSRVFLQRFIDVCCSTEKQPADELFSYRNELWNAFEGPTFRCDMLVDTTCENECDWQRLTQVPYIFSSSQSLPYDELFVCDVDLDSPGDAVTLGKLMRYSCHVKGKFDDITDENWCSVPG